MREDAAVGQQAAVVVVRCKTTEESTVLTAGTAERGRETGVVVVVGVGG